jgi:hypothetical protein
MPKKTPELKKTEAIEKALGEGPKSNVELRKSLDLSTEKYDPRLDRELQKLRKDGKIHLVGGRWALKTIEACPTCSGKGWIKG